MSSTVLGAVILLVCALTFSAAQTSCKSRCGDEYYRGYMCQCDYNCLSYGECCKDFESQCTTKNSCKGRCGENFKRGRLCSCDSDCADYKQCCPDHNIYCDSEEPTEATEPSTFSEGNNADMNSQIFPNDEFSNNEVEDLEKSPIPESTSGYGSSTADLLDHISTEPIQDPDILEFSTETFTVFTTIADNEPTQADDGLSTLYPTIAEAPTESTVASDSTSSSDPGTTLPHPTTAADFSQPTPTSVHQTEYSPTANTPELETANQAEVQPEDDIFSEDPTVAPSDEPEVTTLSKTASYTPVAPISTGPTQGSSTVLENSQVTTIPASTLNPTPIPEATTSHELDDTENNTESVTTDPPSSLADLEDPPTSVSPEGYGDLAELDALTTHIPSSTDVVQLDTTNEVTPGKTTANPLNVTPDPTKSAPSKVPSKPQDQPDPYKPSPAKQTLAKPSSKPETKPLDTAQTLNVDDPPTSVSPEGYGDLAELDALTTHIPASTDVVQHDTTDEVTPGKTTANPLNVTPDPTKSAPSKVPSKPQDQPDPYKPSPAKPALAKPSSKPETKPLDTAQTLNIDDPRDYQADDSNDTNLCSGRPVGAVTTLRNGTVVVFRGHYFWVLDRYMVPGPARGITQVWGIPSPIDTAFTRCNCQGKTYIFKGTQYWRFENDLLDPNYPKVIQVGFDGLRGQITAALSVPQYQRRRESVYFFKRGGSVQKYSYQFGTSPTCGRKVQYPVYTVRSRMVRQAVAILEPVVNIRTSWRGFPSTITAAVSVPSARDPERYKYYVFSRSKSYNVRIGNVRPVISAPTTNASPQSNDFLKCSVSV
ncbi:proteoglycan 4b isoform X2 [Cebidichthys violaceus]|uniref:proteoglycan 4b isoform X2 n=1 Tax=Cebidichthys violaceus TaxID=271503 RepID=UPI0035CA6B82